MPMKFGRKLKKGDKIKVWWSSYPSQKNKNEDIIEKIENPSEYSRCAMKDVFKEGFRFAYFVGNRVGMTIPNDELFKVIYD